jgi:hypothetical protein
MPLPFPPHFNGESDGSPHTRLHIEVTTEPRFPMLRPMNEAGLVRRTNSPSRSLPSGATAASVVLTGPALSLVHTHVQPYALLSGCVEEIRLRGDTSPPPVSSPVSGGTVRAIVTGDFSGAGGRV